MGRSLGIELEPLPVFAMVLVGALALIGDPRLGIAVGAVAAALGLAAIARRTLARARRRTADRILALERQRDDLEILYRFTDQVSRAVRPAERRRRVVELATRFLGTECVLVRVDDPERLEGGTGRITMRDGEICEDHEFTLGPDGPRGVPTFLAAIIRRWTAGEFDGLTRVEAGWVSAYPLTSHERRLGLLLLPTRIAAQDGEAGPGPDLVAALTRHVGSALEFSDLQTELVGQERLAAIGETVAGLAHCLKNVLNGLRSGQYVVDRAVDQGDMPKIHTGWRIMRKGIGQVEALAFNMLYAATERAPCREPIDPNVVLAEVADLVRGDAARQGITVAADLDETIGECALDRMTIYRSVLNLVTNALDACLETEKEESRVVVRSRGTAGEIVIEVEDDGEGMTEETRARLFTRFFTTKTGKGTGLGLPVVKKVIEEHGGRLEIESRPGLGSLFRIRLPRTSPPRAEASGS